jgi:hypothetical protein
VFHKLCFYDSIDGTFTYAALGLLTFLGDDVDRNPAMQIRQLARRLQVEIDLKCSRVIKLV